MNDGPELAQVERAMRLHERGWSYRKIARRLQVSLGTAFNWVNSAYDDHPELGAKRDSLKAAELLRLDRVIARLDRALRSTDDEVAVKAGAGLVKASESRRKLLGLDAPTKVERTEGEKQHTEAELWERIEKLKKAKEEGKDGMH